ncbi:MAG: DUF4334 domain-containing protein [Alcanivoracaceae bacterium]|nr:DUF4334 domain-containing protein [Alcanivoracaceae bacterium]
MTAFAKTLNQGPLTCTQALALYDSLDAIDTDFMLGQWRGAGFATGHPLDGVLEACHWYGKNFTDADNVDPLMFRGMGNKLYRLNPSLMPMGLLDRLPTPTSTTLGNAFRLMMPLLQTHRSRARLRMIEYRGKTSAAMLYDDLPINDVFRKLDDNTVLGIMDLKGMAQPFFFQLKREQPR